MTGVIDGTLLGGRLTLDTKVVLMRPGSGSAPMAPRRPGSTLWAKTTRFDLEGTDARFPVLPLSFSASGIAGGRKGAWALVVENPDLSSLAVGSLRLYLNTDHPAIGSLLDSADSPENRWVQEFLRYDTARQLVTAALANDELRTGIEYDSGSLGDLLIRMISNTLGSRDIEMIRADWKTDPGQIEAELQAALQMLVS